MQGGFIQRHERADANRLVHFFRNELLSDRQGTTRRPLEMQRQSVFHERQVRGPRIDIVDTVERAAGFLRNKIRHDVQMEESLEPGRRVEYLRDAWTELRRRTAGRSAQEIIGCMGTDDERSNKNGQGNDEQK